MGLGAKLKAKLTKKTMILHLVGKLAEMAKILKNVKFFKVFGSLGLPTSKQNYQKNVPRPIKNQVRFGSVS